MPRDRPRLMRCSLQPWTSISVNPHSESYHEFHYVVRGSGDFRFTSGHTPCGPGDCFYTEAQVRHHMHVVSGEDPVLQYVCWLDCAGTDLARALRQGFAMGTVRNLGTGRLPFFQNLGSLLQREEPGRWAAHHLFLGLLWQLLAEPTLPADLPEPVAAGVALMHRELDRPITLAHLAKVAGTGRVALVRLWRRHLGTTPMAHLRELRLQAALAHLRGGLGVAEAGQRCGFDDPFHFSRVFRMRYGVPPSRWQRI